MPGEPPPYVPAEKLLHDRYSKDIREVYSFECQLEAGVCGVAHLIRDQTTSERKVCLQFVKGDFNSADGEKAFRDEVDAWFLLNDEPVGDEEEPPPPKRNTLFLRDAFEDQWHVNLITDYCSGGYVLDRLCPAGSQGKPSRPLAYSEGDVATIILATLRGLMQSHARGVVHRDLDLTRLQYEKPGSENLIIVDYRLCRQHEDVHPFSHKLVKVIKRGVLEETTPYFVSPELQSDGSIMTQVVEKESVPVTPLSDSWSVGAMAFSLVAGTAPFMGRSKRDTAEKIRTGELVMRGANWREVSGACKDFISRMMSPEPKDRYSVTQALAHPWICGAAGKVKKASLSNDVLRSFRKRFRMGRTVAPDTKIELSSFVKADHVVKLQRNLLGEPVIKTKEEEAADAKRQAVQDAKNHGVLHGPPIPGYASMSSGEFVRAVQASGLFTDGLLDTPEIRHDGFNPKRNSPNKHMNNSEEYTEAEVTDCTKVDAIEWRQKAKAVLGVYALGCTERNLDDLFASGDRDGSGLIDFIEFVRLTDMLKDGSWKDVIALTERRRRERRERAADNGGDNDGDGFPEDDAPPESLEEFAERTDLFCTLEEWWKPLGGNWVGTMTNHDFNPRPLVDAIVEQHRYDDAERLLRAALKRFGTEVERLQGTEGEDHTLPKDTNTVYDMRELILDDGIFQRACSYELNYEAIDCLKLPKGVAPGTGSDVEERVDCRELIDSLLNVRGTFYAHVL